MFDWYYKRAGKREWDYKSLDNVAKLEEKKSKAIDKISDRIEKSEKKIKNKYSKTLETYKKKKDIQKRLEDIDKENIHEDDSLKRVEKHLEQLNLKRELEQSNKIISKHLEYSVNINHKLTNSDRRIKFMKDEIMNSLSRNKLYNDAFTLDSVYSLFNAGSNNFRLADAFMELYSHKKIKTKMDKDKYNYKLNTFFDSIEKVKVKPLNNIFLIKEDQDYKNTNLKKYKKDLEKYKKDLEKYKNEEKDDKNGLKIGDKIGLKIYDLKNRIESIENNLSMDVVNPKFNTKNYIFDKIKGIHGLIAENKEKYINYMKIYEKKSLENIKEDDLESMYYGLMEYKIGMERLRDFSDSIYTKYKEDVKYLDKNLSRAYSYHKEKLIEKAKTMMDFKSMLPNESFIGYIINREKVDTVGEKYTSTLMKEVKEEADDKIEEKEASNRKSLAFETKVDYLKDKYP